MQISMYAMSVEQIVSGLTQLNTLLAKGAAFAEAKKLEPGVLENARLAPDMFHLIRQVHLCCDIPKNGIARLADSTPPKLDDTETTLAELQTRVTRTIDYLKSLTPASVNGTEDKQITVPLRTRTLELKGLPFLQKWVLPNFYFHLTTAYNLLRHNGVDVGKNDFLGAV